jgi:hypothetical protein
VAKILNLKGFIQRSEEDLEYRIWFFFKSRVPAIKAIKLGKIIMNRAYGKVRNRDTFFRFFPSKTGKTKDKLGDAIPVPFYGKATEEDDNVFLNPEKGWEPYPSIEVFSENIIYSEPAFIKNIVAEAGWMLKQKESN